MKSWCKAKQKAERLKICSITIAMQKQQHQKTSNKMVKCLTADYWVVKQHNICTEVFSYNWPLIWASMQEMQFRKCNRKREKPWKVKICSTGTGKQSKQLPETNNPRKTAKVERSFEKNHHYPTAKRKKDAETNRTLKWLLKTYRDINPKSPVTRMD